MQEKYVIQDRLNQDLSFEEVSETFLPSLFEQHSWGKTDFGDLSLSRKEMMAEQSRDPEILK